MDASTLEVCEREHLIEEHIPRPQSVLRMDLSHYWISRVVALGAGFTCALLLAQALGPKVARGKTEGGGGQFLQEWKFEEVNVNSGDKVFDVLFNQTLYDCIEPVKHIADKRGRCYDTIFARQHKCYALRKEEPPASCKRTVKCLQGKKDEKPINPCEWLCTGGNRNQAWVKERCDKAAHDAMRWSGKCLDHGYEQRSFEAMEDVNVLSQRCVDETTSTTTQVGSHFFCWAPLDHQYLLELPEDLARRAEQCLRQDGEAPPLELEILEKEELSGDLGPRHFHVKAWGEEMHGTVVDLPCRVESHILPPGASQALYKSADVAQMLIVHRENEVPGAERYLDKKTFRWRSGLTPPTQLVVDRRFRGVPPSHSMFAPALIRETNAALKSRMANHPFTYEEEGEVDEAFCENIRKEDPQSVWRPPEGLAGSGPSKAPGHASAASPARPNHRASPGPASVLSQKGHASAASPARPNHRASPGPASVLSQKGAASEVSARSDANTEGKAVKKLKITAKKK